MLNLRSISREGKMQFGGHGDSTRGIPSTPLRARLFETKVSQDDGSVENL
jgi:hypothetical protein